MRHTEPSAFFREGQSPESSRMLRLLRLADTAVDEERVLAAPQLEALCRLRYFSLRRESDPAPHSVGPAPLTAARDDRVGNPEAALRLNSAWAATTPWTHSPGQLVEEAEVVAVSTAVALGAPDMHEQILSELLVTAGIAGFRRADLGWSRRVVELTMRELPGQAVRWLPLALRFADRESRIRGGSTSVNVRALIADPGVRSSDNDIDIIEAARAFAWHDRPIRTPRIELDARDPLGIAVVHSNPLRRRTSHRAYRLLRLQRLDDANVGSCRLPDMTRGATERAHAKAVEAIARLEGDVWAGREPDGEAHRAAAESIDRCIVEASAEPDGGEAWEDLLVDLVRHLARRGGGAPPTPLPGPSFDGGSLRASVMRESLAQPAPSSVRMSSTGTEGNPVESWHDLVALEGRSPQLRQRVAEVALCEVLGGDILAPAHQSRRPRRW